MLLGTDKDSILNLIPYYNVITKLQAIHFKVRIRHRQNNKTINFHLLLGNKEAKNYKNIPYSLYTGG